MSKGILQGQKNNIEDSQLNSTINEYFEEMVERQPKSIAIIDDNLQISYEEFNVLSNKLARTLASRGIGQGDRVALCFERSVHMMVAIMAIIKLGAAYIPIGLSIPNERVNFMLNQSGAKLFLVQNLKFSVGAAVETMLYDMNLLHEDGSNLDLKFSNSNLAYILYTSGSVGEPKGVMIQHKSVINHILWRVKCCNLSINDVFFFKTPYTFDISVWEIFLWFFVGAKLDLCLEGNEGNVEYILTEINKRKISVCQFVPSMLLEILKYALHRKNEDKLKTLRVVYSGGEVLHSSTVSMFNELLTKKYETVLYNVYGPTETTIDSTYFCCNNIMNDIPNNIPIGIPIWNNTIYIIDNDGNLCEEGVEGEIYISGQGVALGYIDQECNESFIENPWNEGICYRTGDMGKIVNGMLQFCGRKDKQVKIRGMRVELEEIESLINTMEGVTQSVAVYLNDSKEGNLYVVYVAEQEITTDFMEKYLSRWLPKYMIPNIFIKVKNLFYTTSGKVDKNLVIEKYIKSYNRKLESIDQSMSAKSALNPREVMVLDAICSSINVTEEITSKTRLFDVGIDSLKFISLIISLEEKFNFEFTGDMLLADKYPTVYDMARYVTTLWREE